MPTPEQIRAFQARMQDEEPRPGDVESVERFMAEHGGLTPLQWALHMFPSAREEVEACCPELAPSRELLAGPAINRPEDEGAVE